MDWFSASLALWLFLLQFSYEMSKKNVEDRRELFLASSR